MEGRDEGGGVNESLDRMTKVIERDLAPLNGAVIKNPVASPDGYPGILLVKDGEETILWLTQDAEDNGPGWYSLESK
jgi:hypothetical protein